MEYDKENKRASGIGLSIKVEDGAKRAKHAVAIHLLTCKKKQERGTICMPRITKPAPTINCLPTSTSEKCILPPIS